MRKYYWKFFLFYKWVRNAIGSEIRSKRRTRNVRRNVWRSVCLFIRVKYRVSRAYRKTNVPKAALRAVVRSRPGKRTGNDWKYQVHLYLSRRGEATLAKVRVHEGSGNKGWRGERMVVGGHMQLQLWFSPPVPPSCREKGRRLRGERVRDKSDRERWSAWAEEQKRRKYTEEEEEEEEERKEI